MDDETGSEGLAAEHAELRQRYAESQERFADVFRFAPCSMLITRLSDHTILDVNQAWVEESGYSRESVIGLRTGDLPWWQDAALRDRILSEIRTLGRLNTIETRFFDRENREHVALVSGQRISMDGEPCVVWQTLNVTERVRVAEERQALQERIKQREKLESLGLLAGGVAHDFNNLLVGVLGNAEAALAVLPATSPAHSLVRAVVTSGERAAELTRELLDYAGRGTTKLELTEVLTLLWETSELVRPALPKNVTVRMETSDLHLWVRADASQLRRLFMNLIKNAAEAFDGRPGQVLISAHGEPAPEGEWVSIHVRDTGEGMDEVTRARLFEPFFTTKTRGHGLGLAAVEGVVHKHGGTITVTSHQGEGTTFAVRLPRHPAPEPGPEVEPSLDYRGEGTLLLIDDEAHVRATTSMLLELHGFEVRAAASGEQGLELFAAEPGRFRAVVLDSTMPGLDGAETLRRLRAVRPEVPVLLCSGYSRHDLAALLDGHPHVGFLGKPFKRHDLVRALSSLLGQA